MLWLSKLLAIVSLSLGVSLLLLPFPAAVPAKILGGAALLYGAWLMVGTYRQAQDRGGTAIASVGFMLFCDVILLLGGIFCIGLVIDSVWIGLLNRPSLIGLEPEWPWTTPITGLHFVSWPATVIALPLLTLFFTSLSSQRIRIDDAGITSLGAAGTDFISWQDLEQVKIRGQRNPASFTVVDFRKLQNVLDLQGDDHSITINEASRARKQSILAELKAFIPDEKRHLLDGLDSW